MWTDLLWLLVTTVILLYWIAIVVFLISEDRDPATTIAWLFILLLFPFVGLAVYIVAGRDWKRIASESAWTRAVRPLVTDAMLPVYQRNARTAQELEQRLAGTPLSRVSRSIEAENHASALPSAEVTILPSGQEAFDSLKADMASAERFIHLQFFIWECDALTADFKRILLERHAAGVEVRVMYDFVGSLPYSKRELKEMRAAGIGVRADVMGLNKVNYRNHRKIAVIDGRIGHSGGINVGQEYIDGGSRYPAWRDTNVRVTGQIVAEYQKLFAMRWHEDTGEDLFGDRYFPEAGAGADDVGIPTQVVYHGVEDYWESSRRTHMIAISGASARVWIQSPYFVPDTGTYDALVNAALGGVDVRFMMTDWHDKRIAWWAAHSYFRPLLEAGGRVFLYEPGFLHAKTLTVDGQAVAIGTMNLDIRSLRLHKEMMTWFYDTDLTAQHDRIFEADLAVCREITLADLDALGRAKRLRNSAARLASNLL